MSSSALCSQAAVDLAANLLLACSMARIAPFLALVALGTAGCALRTSNPAPVMPRYGDQHAYEADIAKRRDELVAGGKFNRDDATSLAETEAALHEQRRSPDTSPAPTAKWSWGSAGRDTNLSELDRALANMKNPRGP